MPSWLASRVPGRGPRRGARPYGLHPRSATPSSPVLARPPTHRLALAGGTAALEWTQRVCTTRPASRHSGYIDGLPTADRVRQLEDARAARRGARARRRRGGARRAPHRHARASSRPSPSWPRSPARLAGTGIVVGGQDCHAEAKGAFTGSISAPMLKDAGADAVHRRPFRAPPWPGRDRRHGPGQGRGRRWRRACWSSCASARPRRSARRADGRGARRASSPAAGPSGATADDSSSPTSRSGRSAPAARATTADIAREPCRDRAPARGARRRGGVADPLRRLGQGRQRRARSWPCPASPASSSAGRPWMRPGSGPSTRRAAALEPGLAAVSSPATASIRSFP